MASASTMNAGSGRRRSLDAEINLVPFIDLLSMCICFLLVTAVWINVGAVQVKQSRGTESAAVAPNQLEMEARFVAPKASKAPAAAAMVPGLELTFKRAGHVTRKQLVQAPTLAELPALLDAGLGSWAETAAATAASPLISAAMVYPRAGVSYGDLVSVMDVLRKHQIVNLGVVPVAGGS